jgi:hypothetical protein
MQQYYMVLQPSTNYTRYKHSDYQAAKAEAMRLARAHSGQEFVVLAAVATIVKDDIKVDEVPASDHIPF